MSSPVSTSKKRKRPPSSDNDRRKALRMVGEDPNLLGGDLHHFNDDKEVVLAAVSEDGSALQHASRRLQTNKKVVLAAVQQDGAVLAMSFIHYSFRDDEDVCLAALQSLSPEKSHILQCISPTLRDDKEFMLAAGRLCTHYDPFVGYASERLRNSRRFILAALEQGNAALKHASQRLRDDPKIVLRAVQHSPKALIHASYRLQKDRDIAMALVENASNTNHSMESLIQDRFMGDRQYVLAAIHNARTNEVFALLKRASGNLKSDREVVLAAVRKDGNTLTLASRRLRNDRRIVLKAVKRTGHMLEFASDDLQDDEELVREAIHQHGGCVGILEHASDRLRSNKGFILDVTDGDGLLILQYASEELHNNSQTIANVIKRAVFQEFQKDGVDNADLFRKLPERLRDDYDVVKEAILGDVDIGRFSPEMLQFVSVRLLNDASILRKAIRRQRHDLKKVGVLQPSAGNHALDFVPIHDIRRLLELQEVADFPLRFEELPVELRNDKEIALTAVRQDGRLLRFCLPDQQDREIALAAVTENCQAIQYVSESLQSDNDIALSAVSGDGLLLRYLPSCNEKSIVVAAVSQNPNAITHSSEAWKADKEIGLLVVSQDDSGSLIQYLDAYVRADNKVALAAVRKNGNAFQYLPEHTREDRELVLCILEKSDSQEIVKSVLAVLPHSLKSDKEVVLAGMKHDGDFYFQLYGSLAADRDVVILALNNCSKGVVEQLVQNLDDALTTDREIAMAAVKRNGHCLWYFAELVDDREIVLSAVIADASVMQDVEEHWSEDPEFASEAATQNFLVTEHLEEPLKTALRNDPAVVAQVVRYGGGQGTGAQRWWRSYVGADFKKLFTPAVVALRKVLPEREGGDFDVMTGSDKATQVSAGMILSLRMESWHLSPHLPTDVQRLIRGYAGIDEDMRVAKSIQHCAPVIGAFAERGFLWSHIRVSPYLYSQPSEVEDPEAEESDA